MIPIPQRKLLLPVLGASACILLGTLSTTTSATARSFGTLRADVTAPTHETASVIRVQAHGESQVTSIRELQQHLQTLGLYNGAIDGLVGQGTRSGMRRFCEMAERDCGQNFSAEDMQVLARAGRIFILGGRSVRESVRQGQASEIQPADRNGLVEARSALTQGDQAFRVGDYPRAEINYRQAAEGFSRILGEENPYTSSARHQQAYMAQIQGKFVEAEILYREILSTREHILGASHLTTLRTRINLANSVLRQGRYAEALEMQTQLLSVMERALGPNHADTLLTRMNIANANWWLHRYELSETQYREVLAIQERVLGQENQDTVRTRNNLAVAMLELGRYHEAEILFNQVLAVRERILGARHFETLSTRSSIAEAIEAQNRHSEAESHFDLLIATMEQVLGAEHPDTLRNINTLAATIRNQGRYEEAVALTHRVLEIEERVLGTEHPQTLETRNNLALAQLGFPTWSETAFRTWESGFIALPVFFASDPSAGLTVRRELLPLDLVKYLETLSQSSVLSPGVSAYRSFEAQGWLTFSSLDVALADMGARRGRSGAEGEALRVFQEARDRLQSARRAYLASFERAPGSAGEAERVGLQATLRAAEAEFETQQERLARDFPALAELQLPRALTADEAQALLRPGEGLVAYAQTDEMLFAWLVTHDRIHWAPIPVSRAEMAERVTHLRRSLDTTLEAAPPLERGCALTSSFANLTNRPFDLCAAEELHDLVLGQFDLDGIEELIVVADGALEQLPFSVLVTDIDESGRPNWLLEDRALSALPSTSSLRALRSAQRESDGGERLPFLGLAPEEFSDLEFAPGYRYDPLPATVDEVRLISAQLAAGGDGTVLRTAASEAYVHQSDLSRFTVLGFSTHALLSQEANAATGGRIREPALLLRPGDGEDGYLTASEIAGLRLNADWVLLSGCNTAAGGAEDAEGLSGLARAFFFAGARALLVSHWSVDDNATLELTTRTLAHATEGMSRAQALRQAMLEVRDMPGQDFRHPLFWAPFMVVGEGREGQGPTLQTAVATVETGPETPVQAPTVSNIPTSKLPEKR